VYEFTLVREQDFMTSEERNRRIKYGHDVPRWWIPDFNRPPEPPPGGRGPGGAGSPSTEIDDYRIFQRRRRQIRQKEQARRLNRGLGNLQKLVALLIAWLGFWLAGLIGLAIGISLGLLLMAVRLER
jgi:hypothetical protein